MTLLRGTTPTPEQFQDAWREAFEDAIVEAGGADGRLSRASAERIAERDDAGRLASDNAVAFFERTGQKTVSARKLARVLGEDARVAGAAVGGANQRISLREGRRLPPRLQADFFYLRGKGLPDTPTHADFVAEATAQAREWVEAGNFRRLNGVPPSVRFQRPFTEFYDAGRVATFRLFEGNGQLYVSIGAPANSPFLDRVGWYHVGRAPARPG